MSEGVRRGNQEGEIEEISPAEDIETGNAGIEQVPIKRREKIKRQLKLYRAAVNGDWNKALEICSKHTSEINKAITKRGETALHIAVLAEQTDFVKELVKKMSKKGLAHRDVEKNTALFFAATTGNIELAEAILNENENLAMTRGVNGFLPIYIATYFGHKDMVKYLYSKTSKKIEDHDYKDLLVALINADMYDIALNTIKGGKEYLAVAKDKHGVTALHVLAGKCCMLSHAHGWRKCFNLFPRSMGQNMKRNKAKELLELVWEQTISKEDGITDLDDNNWRPIFVAVEQGNVEFLRILKRSYPDLVLMTNEKNQTIFHAAVVSRHEEIFKLIHETGSFKNIIVKMHDDKQNNMLHLAGELAPPDQLNLVPGPAFQLQRELLWFEEVKKVVGPRLAEQKNKNICDTPRTPRELFIKKHEDLIRRGEEWMKNTANYCMIVATLVATVVFAATYTVPGGNDPNTGFPMFLHKPTFKIFAIADAISLIFSISSVIIFLSLLTSTYTLKEFLRSLPNKLVIGLACLFISLLAMMVAFVTAFSVYFKKEQHVLRYALPVALAACIPAALFVWSHRRLIHEVFSINL